MKKGILLSGGLVFLIVVILMPYKSHAVPSYARQVQKPCTACHTIWPNLNQYGRQFKVKAYTDVSQDWPMITKDRLNLATTLPVSARVIFFPEVSGDPGANAQSSSAVDSVALFLASRIYDYAGVFGSWEWSPDTDTVGMPTVKVAFQYPLAEGTTVGLVGFKGLSAAADPFNSLGGRDRTLTWGDESIPFVLNSGWTFDFWSEGNIGYVAHGYFIGNRLYAAVGAMRGGLSADALNSVGALVNSTSTISDTDPYDGYVRVAWDQKLPNGAITFGAAYYDGKQRIISGGPSPIFPYDSRINRTYIDASLEQNFGEDHLFEVQALYGSGEDKNVLGAGDPRKFDGYYLEASYFYQRTVGLVAAMNYIKYKDIAATDATDFGAGGDRTKADSWLLSLNYIPWLNTKIALQYVDTKTTFVVEPDQTDKITRVIMDIAF